MIYCVEDDASIRELVVYTLKNSGYEAEGFEDGGALFAALQKKQPRLILLDIMLPGEDGISLLRRLRRGASTARLPVIMLTARGTEFDKVVGLDSGADDYIAKPFGMTELLSRIKAVLRRAEPAPAKTLCAGGVRLDDRSHTVTSDGTPVELTLKEYELLRLLMENAGAVLTRDRLLTAIWGMDYDGETRTVDVHIRTLRQKLGTADVIETVRGVGYRISAE